MPANLSPEFLQAIRSALENPQFKWRTIPGVAKEAGVEPDLVRRALAAMSDSVVRSEVPSADGSDLFTTRDHFSEFASLSEKLLGAVKNRAS